MSWGRNDEGQLGYKSVDVYQPRRVPFSKQIQQISAGSSHAALITQSGNVYTWGSNHMGQLGHSLSGIGEVPQLKS